MNSKEKSSGAGTGTGCCSEEDTEDGDTAAAPPKKRGGPQRQNSTTVVISSPRYRKLAHTPQSICEFTTSSTGSAYCCGSDGGHVTAPTGSSHDTTHRISVQHHPLITTSHLMHHRARGHRGQHQDCSIYITPAR